ncbi:MAG: hypothetical protein FRX49_09653 [Trebouxia sp. A1-2]|nr:MAG: hypothetical protein FRX49_09653 [Trebouxia sp. A1-2]
MAGVVQQQRHQRRQHGSGAITVWRHLSHGEADKMVADPQFHATEQGLGLSSIAWCHEVFTKTFIGEY